MKAICIKSTYCDGILYEKLLNIYEIECFSWPTGSDPDGRYNYKISDDYGRIHVLSEGFFKEHFKVLDSG